MMPQLRQNPPDMAKINRLGWTDGISFVSFGLRIGIRVNEGSVLERLPELLPPGWKPAQSPNVDRLYSLRVGGSGNSSRGRASHRLYVDAAHPIRMRDLDLLLEHFESDLQRFAAEWARRRVFVHAGVVGWRGRAIVLPGGSYSGKTTLTAALVRAGATYYSDEYAVFDTRGRVHPFSKPLAIRDEGDWRQRKCPPEALGGRTGVKPLPVGLIAVTEFQPGARWRPRVVSAGSGALGLLAHTVPARSRPVAALATLEQVVAHAKTLKGKRGDADEAAKRLLAALDD
jgi:hypothetical protein